MEIIERQAAMRKGLTKFYTGRPCKNGHLSYRYVKSGGCAACIQLANGRSVDDPNVDARREAKAQLVQVKIRLFQVDLEVFKAAAHAMTLARFPVLKLGDVFPGLLPTDSAAGTALYKFNCHETDISQLREIAAGLLAAHRVDFTAPDASRYVKVDPVPAWADKP